MSFTLVGELPRHLYCYVDSRLTHSKPQGFIPCIWFGLVSYPGRLWGCTIMLECGAIYRNVPCYAMSFSQAPEPEWGPKDAQTWDCYGEQFTCLEYRYLSGLECRAATHSKALNGTYLFTAAPIGDAFSAYPDQAKEFCFIQLNNGRLTIQPTNHVVFRERSFTDNTLTFPKGLKRQSETWHCE